MTAPRTASALTGEEYDRVVEAGVLDKIELIEGRVVMGSYEVVFSPEQARAAERVGVRVRSCVDAVLEDSAARAEVIARLADA